MIADNTFNDFNISKDITFSDLEILPGGFFIYKADDDQERLVYANSVILDIFDCADEKEFLTLTGGTFKGMVYPDDYPMVVESVRMQIQSSSTNCYLVNYRIRSKTGAIKHIENYGRYYVHPEKGPLLYVFISTTQSRIDSLTGLAKRRYFLELAESGAIKLLSQSKTPAIVAFDLIGMKNFNSLNGMDEGDQLLIAFSLLISKYFGQERCSRFGEDHFYAYTSTENLDTTLDKIISELPHINNGKYLPVRIGVAVYDPDANIEIGFDRAKAASDTIDSSVESMYVWYSESIERSQSRKNYILTNIDRAISEGWIEPYYQPIVRTFTENLCGFEALARWIDPVKGLISPGDFIPILEKGGMSYKLDMYIAKRAVSSQQQRLRMNQPVVPVSINISRSDFEYCDPVDIIASTCDSMRVRRNLIAIEITETAIMSDNGVIRDAIKRFHESGFEVYMDDFGSGYSSLNILKDFEFDEIKIDMGFLKDFNEKSKTIVSMAVKMAKNLGIHTLAEGVETKEHLDFLKSIGCERIQGYYYGKPMPLISLKDYLNNKTVTLETREIYSLYQKAGLIDVDMAGSFALVFYDKKNFEIIYSNEEYLKELHNIGDSQKPNFSLDLNSGTNTLGQKFRNLADKAIKSDKSEFTTFVYEGEYFHLIFTPVAKSREGVILSAVLDSSIYKKLDVIDKVDKDIRNLISIYECVYFIDIAKNEGNIIVSNIDGENEGDTFDTNRFFSTLFDKLHVYYKEKEIWQTYVNKKKIIDKLKKSKKGYFSNYFLAQKDDGNYLWMEMLILSINESNNKRILMGIKPSPVNELSSENKVDFIKRILDYGYLKLNNSETLESEIMSSLIDTGNLKFFWKDKNRRFLGASKAFYDYYDFKSSDEFVGKTDEEIGWHLNDEPFKQDEENVLKGKIISNATTINVVDGVSHRIVASKVPIYKDNEIVGIFGYLVDADEDIFRDTDQRDKRNIDPVTGLMNSQGMVITLNELGNNFHTNGENYFYVCIDIIGYDEILEDYGNTVALELLCKIAKVLRNSFDERVAISRNDGARFGICTRGMPVDTIYEATKKCVAEINNIDEIDRRSCRISANYGIASGAELKDFQDIIELAHEKMDTKSTYNEEKCDYEIQPNVYLDIPIAGVIVRPLMEKDIKTPKDMIFCFVNKAYCNMTGKRREELIGKGYLETFPETDKKWISMAYRAVKGAYVHDKLYDGATHHWLQFTASPTEHPGACFIICDVL